MTLDLFGASPFPEGFAYEADVLSGAVRSQWDHSIPPVSETRYSLTFRSLAERR